MVSTGEKHSKHTYKGFLWTKAHSLGWQMGIKCRLRRKKRSSYSLACLRVHDQEKKKVLVPPSTRKTGLTRPREWHNGGAADNTHKALSSNPELISTTRREGQKARRSLPPETLG